jgi:hypothetical protein
MKRLIMILAVVVLAACKSDSGMETRTYPISRLTRDEALELLTPYIREGGRLSGTEKLITVREKEERLKVIEELLQKYDGGGVVKDVVLKIQIVEANGFTERDSSIADIEQTLRETFKYSGYRLAGETLVRAREESPFGQDIGTFRIVGGVGRLTGDSGPVQIDLWNAEGNRKLLSSTVTATMGKTVVLGQSSGTGALILVIRPSMAGT